MADVEQVIIVGSGPAGYTAALYTARANLRPLVIEGFLWGGLLQQTTDVENYPGYPEGIMGPEMMQQFRDQAERFGTRFITDNVTRIEPGAHGEPHTVWVDEDEYKARTVVLAMGAEHKKLAARARRSWAVAASPTARPATRRSTRTRRRSSSAAATRRWRRRSSSPSSPRT